MKFKVGDFIKGTDRFDYGITDKEMTKAKVTKINNDSNMTIEVLEHSLYPDQVGEEYEVNSEDFDLWEEEKADVLQPSDLEPKPKFKVGDTLKVTNALITADDNYVGFRGEVKRMFIGIESGWIYCIGNADMGFCEEQLELINNNDDDYVMPTKPVYWDLTLTFKDTDQYLQFIKKLIKYERTVNKGRLPFEYYVMPQEDWSVEVTISRCWADNLKDMAKLLSDVEYEAKGKK